MDDLCELFDSMLPVNHDEYEEYSQLEFSSSLSVIELANSEFLIKSFDRYSKYKKYILDHLLKYKDGVILELIDNFFICKYEVTVTVLAIKCKNIDKHILKMLKEY